MSNISKPLRDGKGKCRHSSSDRPPGQSCSTMSGEESYGGVFQKFCSSSTVHGTYFWSEAKNPLGKLVWVIIVVVGVLKDRNGLSQPEYAFFTK